MIFGTIFTEEAKRNIAATGNVWGTTTKYIYNRVFVLLGRKIRIQQKRKSNAWGRFGGGWNINFGFQVGGSSVIINLFVMSIRIERAGER